jgi:hypothetical protein
MKIEREFNGVLGARGVLRGDEFCYPATWLVFTLDLQHKAAYGRERRCRVRIEIEIEDAGAPE